MHDKKGPKTRTDRAIGDNAADAPKNRGQFAPGTNSHTGEVFRRGEDRIPRLSMKLMLGIVQLDMRKEIYDVLCFIVRTGRKRPRAFLKLIEMIGDRTEGKPTQHVVAEHRAGAIFMRDDTPSPVEAGEEGERAPHEAETDERVDLLAAFPIRVPVTAATVLPPEASK